MSEIRMIKKYPNRRLYDTTISSYITLEDIRQLVLDNESFRVIDAQSEEDITKYTLFQLIIEQEERGTPMFTENSIRQMLKLYGNKSHDAMTQYLEESMHIFADLKTTLAKLDRTNESAIQQTMEEFTQRKLNSWQSFQTHLVQEAKDAVDITE